MESHYRHDESVMLSMESVTLSVESVILFGETSEGLTGAAGGMAAVVLPAPVKIQNPAL